MQLPHLLTVLTLLPLCLSAPMIFSLPERTIRQRSATEVAWRELGVVDDIV